MVYEVVTAASAHSVICCVEDNVGSFYSLSKYETTHTKHLSGAK